MDEMTVVTVGREAIKTALMIGLPVLLSGMFVGVIVSIFQVATSIQDMTITFIPKIIIVFGILALMMHWMLRILMGFLTHVCDMIAAMGA